ncbi:restriction endonuclease subunit S [Mannheimia sp. E30BD]|uniref:restriction endonuclease subunit S n=1 Tax=Mannheimia sp. E30BD TaxID=3278708 RepID=UPI00359E6BC0
MNTATKPTQIAWLGDIPSHWELRKAKYLFQKMERAVRSDDEIVTCFRDGQVTLRSNRRTEGFTNALKEHGYQGVRKGDLVIHAMDAFAGAIGISDADGKSTPVYSVCIPRLNNQVNVYFYAYFLRNLALSGFIQSLAKGIRERSTDFRFADFAQLELPLPPLPEQIDTACFLNKQITQIQKAITLKGEQIAKLKEYRQTLINQAVTQGLNPDVPMKNSGVEWLGDVPEHWEVKKLKYVSDINLQTLPENINKNIMIDYVDIGSISFENGIEKVEQFTFGNAPSRARRIAKAGDTIVSTVRTYLKAISIVTDEFKNCIFSTGFAILSPKNGIANKFLANMLKSDAFTIQVTVNSKGMSYPAINSTELSNLFVVIPPLPEQTAIAQFLDNKTAQIDTAICQHEQQISLLKEYRERLISDAVTGKIHIQAA